jgi:hypothetical protein
VVEDDVALNVESVNQFGPVLPSAVATVKGKATPIDATDSSCGAGAAPPAVITNDSPPGEAARRGAGLNVSVTGIAALAPFADTRMIFPV